MSSERDDPADDASTWSTEGSHGGSLLEVEDLHTFFKTDSGDVKAVDGVSFSVDRGETVAIVGESGSGKTVTSESITRLFRNPPGYIPEGSIRLGGDEVTEMSDAELRQLRGGRVSHIFQNPQGALNPVFSIGWQLREAINLHQDVSKAEANERAVQLLTQVGIPEASSRLDDYPHELSGGMKQRVVIAIALACEPDLLIADEPTTALDVTIQAQILKLLKRLQEERDMAMLFITHDLGVVAEIADRVVVMYAGKVMEQGPVDAIFDTPAHPYTRALMECLPGKGQLGGIPGDLPDPRAPPDGCRFAERCEYAIGECRDGEQPPLYQVEGDPDHTSSCVYYRADMDASVVLGSDDGGTAARAADGGVPVSESDAVDPTSRDAVPDDGRDTATTSYDADDADVASDDDAGGRSGGDGR